MSSWRSDTPRARAAPALNTGSSIDISSCLWCVVASAHHRDTSGIVIRRLMSTSCCQLLVLFWSEQSLIGTVLQVRVGYERMRSKELEVGTETARAVKAARMLFGWSQKDLADRCGVSLSVLKRLESLASLEEAETTKTGMRRNSYVTRRETVDAIVKSFEDSGLSFRFSETSFSLEVSDSSAGSGNFFFRARHWLEGNKEDE